MLRNKLKTSDGTVGEEKLPNRPQKTQEHPDRDQKYLRDHNNIDYPVFETEPNDLLPDDQVFDLIGDDFDEQLKDFDSGQKRKEADPTRRFTQAPARASKQPRLSFRQKRMAQQTEARKKQADER